MRLINQTTEIWEQSFEGDILVNMFKHIERVGRVCYKSEDKITEDSYKGFIKRLIEQKHYAMLEHGTIYLFIPWNEYYDKDANFRYFYNKYSEHNRVDGVGVYITTNYRVIIENGWEKDLKFICKPTEHHLKRVTVHCITSRQIAMELIRHRVMSFAMESTRYCNYSMGKFGNELTFVNPHWCDYTLADDVAADIPSWVFKSSCETIEKNYFELLKNGWKPQQAATILPNSLKADIIITGSIKDWDHLFSLRVLESTGPVHPQMKELMTPLYELFKYKKLLWNQV